MIRITIENIAKKYGGIRPEAIQELIQLANNERLSGIQVGISLAGDILNRDTQKEVQDEPEAR